MATVCQKCGVQGYSELLIYCMKCQVFAEHRYCLDEIPPDPDVDVNWLCELCSVKVTKAASLNKLGLTIGRDKEMLGMSLATDHPLCKTQKACSTCSSTRAKEEEGKSLWSYNQRLGGDKKRRRRLILDDEEGSADDTDAVKVSHNCTAQDAANANAVEMNESHDFPPSQEALSIGPISCTKSLKPVLEQEKVHAGLQFPEGHSVTEAAYVYSQPIIEPIWRGSFLIDNESYGKISAHLSNKSCSKVWERANMFPVDLYVGKLSRTCIWPKSFENSFPTDENIGLYFFSQSERDEIVFQQLLDEINKMDLALCATIEEAELLVFSSLLLPQQYHIKSRRH